MLELLKSEIRRAVITFCSNEICSAAMLEALSRPGYALNPDSHCRAGVLTLSIAQSLRGTLSYEALLAAAGVELQMEAAFMFDDVADDEVDPKSDISPAEQLALAIGLMSCGAAVASEAAKRSGLGAKPVNFLADFHSNYASACAGQFLDAYLSKTPLATTDEALLMTSLKSGSLGKFAAGFGSSVSTDDMELVKLCGEFGFNLFTYLQLVDDLRDACPANLAPRDLLQHKQTVPLVFFYNYLKEQCAGNADAIMQTSGLEASSTETRLQYQNSGADLFCAIIAETFLERARANLTELCSRGGMTENLERFVRSLEISPQELFAAA